MGNSREFFILAELAVLTILEDARAGVNTLTYPIQVLDQDLEFLILNGDTVYLDTTDYNRIWNHHMEQRQIEPFANIIRQRPVYATFDNHDYGPNNSDRTMIGKENSLRAFKDVFANPSYGTKDLPGIFTTFQYGDVRWTVIQPIVACFVFYVIGFSPLRLSLGTILLYRQSL